jgi:hypothetical protein
MLLVPSTHRHAATYVSGCQFGLALHAIKPESQLNAIPPQLLAKGD